MKKSFMMIVGIIIFVININVYAKDNFYTINKYSVEEYNYILMNKKDYVVAGDYLKNTIKNDSDEYEDYQIMLVKYNLNNDIVWKYSYGSTIKDVLYSLNYHYNNELLVDGYLLVVNKTANVEEYDNVNRPYFVVVDEDGKSIVEKEASLEDGSIVNSVINTTDSNGNIDGYLIVGEVNNVSFIAKYDLDLNLVWNKSINIEGYNSTIIKEIGEYNNSYVAIVYNNDNSYRLIKLDGECNFEKIVKEDFEEKDIPHLLLKDNNYVVYGLTDEVKINKKAATSYYIIEYNEADEVVWDVIGDVSVNREKLVKLNNNSDGFSIMYYHGSDSIEVVKINKDSTIGDKIKKIKNNYYNINDYVVRNNTIYFIGQINCPDDDNCDFDANCLLLVSDENKVIEVKDNDSKNILIVIAGLFIGIYLILFYVKRKKKLAI